MCEETKGIGITCRNKQILVVCILIIILSYTVYHSSITSITLYVVCLFLYGFIPCVPLIVSHVNMTLIISSFETIWECMIIIITVLKSSLLNNYITVL